MKKLLSKKAHSFGFRALVFAVITARNIHRHLTRRSGPVARLLGHPNPLKRPWNWPTIELARDVGLGDVLMCTPVLREVKRRNPRCYIRFYTEFGPLVNGLP